MNILYLHQYFRTRSDIGGTRSFEFAKRMVRAGHRVTIMTSSSSDLGWKITRKSKVAGIDVIEVRGGYSDYVKGTGLGYFSRVTKFLAFAAISSIITLTVKKPDVIFATSTPLTIGIPGIIASARFRVPMVFEVRDLWPEAPIQMGALRNPFLRAAAKSLELFLYKKAKHIVALSPGMKEGIIKRGIQESKISMIPNAADLDLFSPDLDPGKARKALKIEDRFVCSYFGSMGEANDLGIVLEAALLLKNKNENNIIFVLHGAGKRRIEFEEKARENKLSNVIFSSQVPDKSAVADLLAASDVGMTIYKNLPVLHTCSPNKLFDTFAAGRAAIVNTPGWLQSLVEDYKIGFYVDPENPNDLVERIEFLRDNPDIVKEMGRNARRLATSNFDREKLANQLIEVLE
ncbi:MAG: glycosyltransferase WbuB [Chloroflexi bacterium]|nr:glycosyltransferase WbuB [Chloroflexota bacterium]